MSEIIVEGPVFCESERTGWICPKCGSTISPNVPVCPYCSTQNISMSEVPKLRLDSKDINNSEQMILS